MNKASVPYSKRKSQPEIRAWNGLNRTQSAGDGEVVDCRNLSTSEYPALQVRDGRTRVGEWEAATDVYETDGHMVVIDDNKLYYDGTFLSNVDNRKKQFVEINRKLVVWPDRIYINLNTGEVGNLEASVSGSVSIREGGVLTVSSASGNGKKEYKNVGGWYYERNEENNYLVPQEYRNTFFRYYTNLSYANGWVYDKAYTGSMPEGAYFIGSAPQTSWNEYEQNWSMEGTTYGKVTKVTTIEHEYGGIDPNVTDYEDGGSYDVIVEYELYNAGGMDLISIFEEGDTVNLQGAKLSYNNRENAVIEDVGKNTLTIGGGFVEAAKYYDVTEAKTAGVYRLVTGYVSYSDSYSGIVFRTERALRAGEQLFAVTDAGDTGLSTNVVYAYDPQTKTLEQFETDSSTSYEDLMAKDNSYTASSAQQMSIERKVPDMQYICERDNRLYGVSNAEEEKIFNTMTGQYETVTSRVLHASALGQPTRWNVYEGASTDSYAVAVAGEGDFTAICNYSGSVLAFKEDRMYKLTGDYPAEFYLRSYSVDGVKEGCHKSLAIINEVLYYLSPYGVMSFTGGVPSLVSYNLGLQSYEDAVAGRDNTDYYISMKDKDGYKIHCYDTVRDMWSMERAEQATGIERVGERAYACIDGKVWKLSDPASQETVSWEATLPETDEGTFDKKRYKTLRLIANVEGVLRVYTRQNDHEEWSIAGTIDVPGKKIHTMNLDTIRCDRLQIKLEGEGKATVWALERTFTIEGEK